MEEKRRGRIASLAVSVLTLALTVFATGCKDDQVADRPFDLPEMENIAASVATYYLSPSTPVDLDLTGCPQLEHMDYLPDSVACDYIVMTEPSVFTAICNATLSGNPVQHKFIRITFKFDQASQTVSDVEVYDYEPPIF